MCIYAEPDSIFPEIPDFEFLRPKKFRIKTMKMAGVISQGIVFPLSILPLRNKKYVLGEDVTELIGITKYKSEPDNSIPQPTWMKNPIVKKLLRYKIFRTILLPNKEYKGFPKFISKTDEENVQNLPYLFSEEFKNVPFAVREKLEGQSGTWFLQRKKNWFGKEIFEFGVCSRNIRKFKKDNSSFWKVAIKYNIENILKELIGDKNEWIAIQGECVGPGIQGNIYKLNDVDVYMFNYIEPKGKMDDKIAEVVMNSYSIRWCPLIDNEYYLPSTANDVLEYSNGTSLLYNTDREGLVFRNYEKNISFKARSPKYLLKSDT